MLSDHSKNDSIEFTFLIRKINVNSHTVVSSSSPELNILLPGHRHMNQHPVTFFSGGNTG
jgi:hypothetical protein